MRIHKKFNINYKKMKKKDLFAALCTCALVAVLIAVVVYGVSLLMASENPEVPKYSPERYVCVMEEITDEDGFSTTGRTCLYDVVERKVIDGDFPEDIEDQLFGYVVLSKDYDRIYDGKVTEEEFEAMKYWMALSNDEHPEMCEVFYDNDGKVIGHHHTIDGQIVEPSVKCEVKVEVEGKSLEKAYHVIAHVNKKNQPE